MCNSVKPKRACWRDYQQNTWGNVLLKLETDIRLQCCAVYFFSKKTPKTKLSNYLYQKGFLLLCFKETFDKRNETAINHRAQRFWKPAWSLQDMKTGRKAMNMIKGWSEMFIKRTRNGMKCTQRQPHQDGTLAVHGGLGSIKSLDSMRDGKEAERCRLWCITMTTDGNYAGCTAGKLWNGCVHLTIWFCFSLFFFFFLLALVGSHDTWCISRGQVSDCSWPFVWRTKLCHCLQEQRPPPSSQCVSVQGAQRHFHQSGGFVTPCSDVFLRVFKDRRSFT